jgi:hypothetical protein
MRKVIVVIGAGSIGQAIARGASVRARRYCLQICAKENPPGTFLVKPFGGESCERDQGDGSIPKEAATLRWS